MAASDAEKTVDALLAQARELPEDWRLVFGRRVLEATPANAILPEYPQSHVLPIATYSPWLTDPDFQAIYKAVEGNTMLDPMRAWEIWELAIRCAQIDGAFIEVGVWRGGSGAMIGKAAERFHPNRSVYLADTFAGTVKGGPEDTYYQMRDGEHSDTSQEHVEGVLKKAGVTNCKILKGIFPDDSAHLATDKIFAFAHIDVDVYRSALDVFDWVFPRMPTGGIVVFDDYGFKGCEGVTKLVNDMKPLSDRVCFHNLNGHGIVVKL